MAEIKLWLIIYIIKRGRIKPNILYIYDSFERINKYYEGFALIAVLINDLKSL